MPDISKINNVAVADISKLDSITFAHGMKVNNQDVSLITDAHTLISTHTVDAACGCIDITSGIDSTYDVYEFHFTNMHPATDDALFSFQVNASNDTGGGFDTSLITSAFFRAYHLENDGSKGLDYRVDYDQAQGAAYQNIAEATAGSTGEDDASASGVLTLYAPSSITYVKHFTARVNHKGGSPVTVDSYTAGYINQTLAIPEISFKFSSGNIDAGQIKMYGIAKA